MKSLKLRIGFFVIASLAVAVTKLSAATNDGLIDAAKREGELVYYASMNLAEANAVIGEFEKRHPFIKVKLHRTGSEKLLTRVLTEFRAKKTFADIIQTVEFSMHIFNRSGVLARYLPQSNASKKKAFGPRSITTPTSPPTTPAWCHAPRLPSLMTTCSIANGRASC